MDLFERIVQDFGPLGNYREVAEGKYIFPKLKGELSNRMEFDGKEMVVWSINNYLGLGNHPEVRKADTEAMAEYGAAYPMGARMMSGSTDLHEELENELAEFVDKEKAVLLNFGYQGIMSCIDSLVSRHDVVVYDAECHACIMDALRMHPGKRYVYKHNDVADCEKQLQRAQNYIKDNPKAAILVITEGVFGMKGDQGKLREIVSLKEQYNFRLLVDDAHGFGTLGETGAGTGEAQGVQDEIDVYFSTFAKSMASIGAFIAGDKIIMDYLRYNMRSQIFAKTLPSVLTKGAMKRLELLKTEHSLREKLWTNVNNLQNGLKEAGFNIGPTNTCVTPVFLNGTVEEAMPLVQDLRDNYGIFCSIVVYPVIPKGEIILRLIPTAVHEQRDIDETIEAFKAVSVKLKEGAYQQISTPKA